MSHDEYTATLDSEPVSLSEQQTLLRKDAYEQSSVPILTVCNNPEELVASDSFKTFLRIFNTVNARYAQQKENYGYKPADANMLLSDKATRDAAYSLWRNTRICGTVDSIQELEDRLINWMSQLDELNCEEDKLRAKRQGLMKQQ